MPFYVGDGVRRPGRRPLGLLESDILSAIKLGKSLYGASRILNVHYQTLLKYCDMYKDENGVTLREKYRWSSPGSKGFKMSKSYYNSLISGEKRPGWINVDGKYRNEVHMFQFKAWLIKYGLIEDRCHICGYNESRVIDMKKPLVVDFIDEDRGNFKLDNLRLLCYNCNFQVGNTVYGYGRTNWEKKPF